MKMLWLCVALALVGAQKEAAADVSEVICGGTAAYIVNDFHFLYT